MRFAGLSLGLLFVSTAMAGEESQLIESINAYRSQLQRCAGSVSSELPPLSADPRLALSATSIGNLQQAMVTAGYPMKNVQAISLSGPRDAASAMKAIQESFCQIVLDPQFVDVGVSHQDRDWRIVSPVRCSAHAWATGRPKARNCWPNSTSLAAKRANVARSPSAPPRR
jgi:uncharacterized protein YkwD